MAECMLLTDKRPIEWIAFPGEDAGCFVAGKHGVITIEVVHVAGQGGYVPWFRVDHEDGSCRLVNAAHIGEVAYAKT